jgi:hypothetical protein
MSRAGKSSANTSNSNSNSNSLNRNRNRINTSRRNTPNIPNNIASNQFNRQFNTPFSRNHISRTVSCHIIAENEDEFREQYLEIQNMMLRLRIEYLTRSIRNHFRNVNRHNPNYRVSNIIYRHVRRRLDYEDSVNSDGGDTSTDNSSSSDSENENFHIVP